MLVLPFTPVGVQRQVHVPEQGQGQVQVPERKRRGVPFKPLDPWAEDVGSSSSSKAGPAWSEPNGGPDGFQLAPALPGAVSRPSTSDGANFQRREHRTLSVDGQRSGLAQGFEGFDPAVSFPGSLSSEDALAKRGTSRGTSAGSHLPTRLSQGGTASLMASSGMNSQMTGEVNTWSASTTREGFAKASRPVSSRGEDPRQALGHTVPPPSSRSRQGSHRAPSEAFEDTEQRGPPAAYDEEGQGSRHIAFAVPHAVSEFSEDSYSQAQMTPRFSEMLAPRLSQEASAGIFSHAARLKSKSPGRRPRRSSRRSAFHSVAYTMAHHMDALRRHARQKPNGLEWNWN